MTVQTDDGNALYESIHEFSYDPSAGHISWKGQQDPNDPHYDPHDPHSRYDRGENVNDSRYDTHDSGRYDIRENGSRYVKNLGDNSSLPPVQLEPKSTTSKVVANNYNRYGRGDHMYADVYAILDQAFGPSMQLKDSSRGSRDGFSERSGEDGGGPNDGRDANTKGGGQYSALDKSIGVKTAYSKQSAYSARNIGNHGLDQIHQKRLLAHGAFSQVYAILSPQEQKYEADAGYDRRYDDEIMYASFGVIEDDPNGNGIQKDMRYARYDDGYQDGFYDEEGSYDTYAYQV